MNFIQTLARFKTHGCKPFIYHDDDEFQKINNIFSQELKIQKSSF